MASTKTRVCCGKRFWKVPLLHLPTNTVSIIILIGWKHRKIVEQIQVCIYRMLMHRQRHRHDIHMTSTNVIKYESRVHFSGMSLFFCILSEVKIMIQNWAIKKHLSHLYFLQEFALIKEISSYKNVCKNVMILWCNYILFQHLDKYVIKLWCSIYLANFYEETTESKEAYNILFCCKI